MPIYQYICEACNNEFELLRRIADIDLDAICPICYHIVCRRMMPTSFTQLHKQTGKRIPLPNTERPNLIMDNVTIENCGTGIKADSGYIKGNNVQLKGNRVGIDSVNTKLEFKGLKIS
jgi:putative FmdB family regulatory protein